MDQIITTVFFFLILHKLRILPFENLDCIEKARPSDNEGIFMQYIYLLS